MSEFGKGGFGSGMMNSFLVLAHVYILSHIGVNMILY